MVRAKKRFGQHFLVNQGVADKIVSSISRHNHYNQLIEVGPGTGVLTERLMQLEGLNLIAVELDREAISYLKGSSRFSGLQLVEEDFLKYEFPPAEDGFGLIGNLPYNISSQIFFKILDHKDQVMEVIAMLQKEVAQRLASVHGNKSYGILSVFLQCWYTVELLFEVSSGSFKPPPKVTSAVIRLRRNNRKQLGCDENLFKTVVKQGFQNRRKTLWNALKPINLPHIAKDSDFMKLRAEQLSVEDFIKLTKQVEEWRKK